MLKVTDESSNNKLDLPLFCVFTNQEFHTMTKILLNAWCYFSDKKKSQQWDMERNIGGKHEKAPF